jgi:glycine oxidase
MSGLSASRASAPEATVERAIVVGAGALGSCIALVLAQAGARVALVDPAALGDNASGVAAGMLAPAFEALLDPPAAAHFPLLCAARDAWPAFAEASGIVLDRSGALWIGEDAAGLEARRRGLIALGAAAEPLSAHEVRRLVPQVGAQAGEGVFTAEDWRLDAGAALRSLDAAGRAAGVERIAAEVLAVEAGACRLADGRRLDAEAIVLATGPGRPPLVPELAALTAVKGHILSYSAMGAAAGPVVRRPGGYGVVGENAILIGATMQAGRDDRSIEPEAVAQLHALGVALFPALEAAAPTPAAAVRATTPDGLPLVGRARQAGIFVAAGARRNGWLLAPLAAQIIAAQIAGRDPAPWAAALDPARFG